MQTKLIKSVLIGDSGVGKTSIIYSALGESFNNTYKATIGADFSYLYKGEVTHQISDTAGQERFMAVDPSFVFSKTDAFIFVVDGTKPLEIRPHIKTQLDDAKRASPDAKFYIVINKCDDKWHDDFLAADNTATLIQIIGIEDFIPIFFCSAKTGKDISALFDHIAKDFSRAPEDNKKLSPETSSTLNPILKQRPKLTKFGDVFIVGNGIIMLGSVALFVLAAFTAGSFLTFGILPSAFIGAAIIMGGALVLWNLGCAIYCNARNAHNSSSHNLDEDKSIRNLDDFDNSVDPKNTSTSSSSYGSHPLDRQQQGNPQVAASSFNSSSGSRFDPSLGFGSDSE